MINEMKGSIQSFGLFNFMVAYIYGFAFILPLAHYFASEIDHAFTDYFFNFLLYGTRVSLHIVVVSIVTWIFASSIQNRKNVFDALTLNSLGLVFILTLLSKPSFRYFYISLFCLIMLYRARKHSKTLKISALKRDFKSIYANVRPLCWCFGVLFFVEIFGLVDLYILIRELHGDVFMGIGG